MALTLRAAVEEAATADDEVPAVSGALARGALLGARGNSGVILSQYLRGLAETLAHVRSVDGRALGEALAHAAEVAHAAVSNPKEGTILTVAREAGRAAREAAAKGATAVAALKAAVAAAREAVAKTPEQLPVLREAGVVDSGGLGLSVTLEGALKHLHGEPLPAVIEDAGHIDTNWLAGVEQAHGAGDAAFGYCVEYVVRGERVPAAELRARLAAIGGSVLVVGDEQLVRVHVHAADPGAALSCGVALGSLTRVKVDNMAEQALRLAAQSATAHEHEPAPAAAGPFSVVAVAVGEGLAGTLRRLGAERVVEGGQTMNPSTRELLAAIASVAHAHVVLLPNNKNIVWTAEQAAKLAQKRVDVIPTKTIPQGIAALIALNPEAEPADALAAMTEAAGKVRTVEVTRAARRTKIGGKLVQPGQPIALVDDELGTAGTTPEEAAITAIRGMELADAPLITIYHGADTPAETAAAFAQQLRAEFPDAEIELLFGGQPFYDYVISVE
jgi:DAK2 domain fusion protein YloV